MVSSKNGRLVLKDDVVSLFAYSGGSREKGLINDKKMISQFSFE